MKGCPVCPLCQLLIMLIVDILFYPHFRISSCSLRYFSSLDAFSSPPSLCSVAFLSQILHSSEFFVKNQLYSSILRVCILAILSSFCHLSFFFLYSLHIYSSYLR